MTKKITIGALLLALIVLTLGANGQGEPEAGGPANEIHMWHTYTQPARVEGIQKMADDFEAETGINVVIEVQTWGGVTQKWPMAYAAGTMPDIVTSVPSDAQAMWAVGAIAPVNNVVDALGGEDAFIAYLDEWKDGDDYISYPFYGMSRLLTYRQSDLDKLGLAGPPETWDELLDAAKKLNDPPSRYGFIPSLKTGSKEPYYILSALTYQLGGQLWDEDLNPTLDTPEALEAAKFMTELWSTAAPQDPFAYETDSQTQLWLSGLTSFLFNGVPVKILAYGMDRDVYDDTRVALLPRPNNLSEDQNTNYTSPRLMSLGNSSEAKKAAAESFMVFMNEHDRKLEFMKTNAFMFPVLRTIAEDPAFIEQDPVRAGMREDIELTFKGMSIGRTAGMDHGFNPYDFLMASNCIELMFQRILGEGVPVEQALEETQADLYRKVQEQKSLLGR